jgi:hypothetical protein
LLSLSISGRSPVTIRRARPLLLLDIFFAVFKFEILDLQAIFWWIICVIWI